MVFIPLLDDDIVSLTGLTRVIKPECSHCADDASISQWTLSLYLMTQCQLKLRHSVTSLARTLDYIEDSQRKHPAVRTLDKLTLKLTELKIVAYVSEHTALQESQAIAKMTA